jgi:hypothetical protein
MAYSRERQYCCVMDGGLGTCTHLSFGKHQGFPASRWIWKLLKIRLVKNPQETSRMSVAIQCSCESPVWSVLGWGHTKQTGNHNFWELLSDWVEHIVMCYLLTRRIINWVADFLSQFIGYYIRRCLQSLITFPITPHEPTTTSGSSSAPSWHKPLLSIFRDELLVMNSYSRLLW